MPLNTVNAVLYTAHTFTPAKESFSGVQSLTVMLYMYVLCAGETDWCACKVDTLYTVGTVQCTVHHGIHDG